MKDNFLRVEEVATILQVSQSYAYTIIRNLNKELKTQGYATISGRINKQFFMEKYFYNKG